MEILVLSTPNSQQYGRKHGTANVLTPAGAPAAPATSAAALCDVFDAKT
jgi:hypothetical protein